MFSYLVHLCCISYNCVFYSDEDTIKPAAALFLVDEGSVPSLKNCDTQLVSMMCVYVGGGVGGWVGG